MNNLLAWKTFVSPKASLMGNFFAHGKILAKFSLTSSLALKISLGLWPAEMEEYLPLPRTGQTMVSPHHMAPPPRPSVAKFCLSEWIDSSQIPRR